MVDVVTVGAGGGSVAWVSPEGALKVGPRSAGADPGPLCYGKGGTEVTVTDAHLVLGRIPPHLLGGEIPLDAGRRGRGLTALAERLSLTAADCAAGILEISAWNQANAVRQITVKRGLDVRDFTLVTFGGSGSLLLCPLIEILGVARRAGAAQPGQRVRVRAAHRRRAQRPRAHRTWPGSTSSTRPDGGDLRRAGRAGAWKALAAQGFGAEAARLSRTRRPALLRAGVRGPGPGRRRAVRPGLAPPPRRSAFHEAHRALYGYDFRSDARQQVEWVNLRVTGIGPIQRPDDRHGRGRATATAARALTGRRPVTFARGSRARRHRDLLAAVDARPATWSRARR